MESVVAIFAQAFLFSFATCLFLAVLAPLTGEFRPSWQGFPRKAVRRRDGPAGRLYKFAGFRQLSNLDSAAGRVVSWRRMGRSRARHEDIERRIESFAECGRSEQSLCRRERNPASAFNTPELVL